MYHGGDPVLQGTRYIIAAFLLLDRYHIDEHYNQIENKWFDISNPVIIEEENNKNDNNVILKRRKITIIESEKYEGNNSSNNNNNNNKIIDDDAQDEIQLLKIILDKLQLPCYLESAATEFPQSNTKNNKEEDAKYQRNLSSTLELNTQAETTWKKQEATDSLTNSNSNSNCVDLNPGEFHGADNTHGNSGFSFAFNNFT